MKKKLILGSALGIIMCSSLIAGATMALFTSESKVNIAVTSGKVDVTATATEVTTYSRGVPTQDGTFENGGTAKIEGGELILDKVTPGDKAVVALKITNNSNVAQQQRISLTGSLDANLMDQLIIGVSETDSNFTYYSDYTTAWTKVEAVTEPVTTTMYVSIELPEYVKNDWQDKSCEITISVEAVQGNADVTSTTVANKVYLVNNQEELTNAIAEMQSGETVILYGGEENWATANIEYTEVKEITVRGYKVGTMTINAPNGTINLYNDVESLTVTSIADNSLHIYGNIGSAEVADGRAVVEPGAYVENVNVVPSESNSVKFEVKATVNNITVNTSSASSADVVIAEGVEVADMTVEGSGDVTLNNSGTISNTTVSEGSKLNSAVATAEQLIAALKISGTTVTLGADIQVESGSVPGISIEQNGWRRTVVEFNGHKLIDNGTGVALYVANAQVVLQDSVGNGGIKGGSGGNNQAIRINGTLGTNMLINSGIYTVGADADGLGNSCIEIGDGNRSEVYINGGTFSSDASYNGKYYVLNLRQSENAVTDTTQFKVRGGTFIGQDPSKGDDNLGGNFLGNYGSYVYASVYTGKTNGVDTWTVVEQQTVNSAEELTAAIENGGVQAIKLGADIAVDKTLVVSANDSFDIDLGGHRLKLVETDRMNILLKVYGKLTVKNGSVYGNGSWGVIYSAGSSILNIDADIESVQSSDNYATLITVADNSVVNILGGSYQNTVTEDDGSGHYDLIYATHNGCVNIYGGTFKNYTPKWTLNCRDADDNSSVNVFGGKYYNFDPSKAGIKGEDTFVGENEVCVAEGYTVTQDGEWYAVVKA